MEINKSSRNIAEFTFFDLQPGTYYLRLHAAFRYKDNYIGDSDNPININVDTPLIISENEALQSLCHLGFAGANFTILRITFPSGLFDDNYYYNESVKVSCKSDSYNSEQCNVVGFGSNCDVYLPSSFSKGEKINLQMSLSVNIFGVYRDIVLNTTYTIGEQKALVSNPSMEHLFNGVDYSVVKVNYSSDIRSYSECYYFMSDNDFSDGEYGILENHNSDYLVIKSPLRPNIERYLRVFGNFGILNLYTSNVYLNIEGSIKYPDDAKKLFEVSSEKNNDNLNIIITPATGFDYRQYSTPTLKCTSTQSSEELLFSANYNYNLSSVNKLVFSLTPSMLEKLNIGEHYILSISGFNLVMGEQYLNSSTDIYELEWIYQ